MNDMNKRKFTILVFVIVALILETLPYGAVLNFGDEDGETLRRTFSYFDPVSYGYANFGPLLTASVTLLLFVAASVDLFGRKTPPSTAVSVISAVGILFSVLPLTGGFKAYSAIGALITLMLAATFFLSVKGTNE